MDSYPIHQQPLSPSQNASTLEQTLITINAILVAMNNTLSNVEARIEDPAQYKGSFWYIFIRIVGGILWLFVLVIVWMIGHNIRSDWREHRGGQGLWNVYWMVFGLVGVLCCPAFWMEWWSYFMGSVHLVQWVGGFVFFLMLAWCFHECTAAVYGFFQ